MSIAVGLLLYAALLAWFGPWILTKLTDSGINPHLGVAAWLTALGGVAAAWLAAIVVVILETFDGLVSGPVWTLCVEFLGHAGQIDMARPAAATVAIALIGAALMFSAAASWRIGQVLRKLRSHSRQHAMAARVVGSPTRWRDVVVVHAEYPAAYCVAGRPRAIVVTTAALASLKGDQLSAVLAHEQAHLRGRHNALLMLLRAVAAGLPQVPLVAAGPEAVARLLEMCADDAAARRYGPHPLLCGLMTLVARPPLPLAALGATTTAVLDRASRLAAPAPRAARWRDRVRLCAAITLTIATPLCAAALCHH